MYPLYNKKMHSFSILIVILIFTSYRASGDSHSKSISELTNFLQISQEDSESPSSQSGKCGQYPSGTIEFPKDDKVHYNLEEWWYSVLQLYTEDGTHYAAQWAFVKHHLQEVPTMELSFTLYDPEGFSFLAKLQSKS